MEWPEYKGPIVWDGIDTTRWDLVPPRRGDIIVAVAAKMGTTWAQMLCALLVHGPELPQALAELSPWLDGGPSDSNEDAVLVFNAQPWRRVIKTHSPLHALKFRADAFYVTCGRDPRDAFLSWVDHLRNSAREERLPPLHPDTLFASFLRAIDYAGMPSLDDAASFWRYRTLPNLHFLHYNEMTDNLEGEMARLAKFLGIKRSPNEIRALSELASFSAMRSKAHDLAPGAKVASRWKNSTDFFRKGRRGDWRQVLRPETQALYVAATRRRYDHRMLDWLETGRSAAGDPKTL